MLKIITPRLADKLIASGQSHTFYDDRFGSTWNMVIKRRDRWKLYGTYEYNGKVVDGVFERREIRLLGDVRNG